ncbi:TraR/DksA C4-type zinc finger protein [Pseudomonas sp. zfem003]|uniref:TraR/DksA C4-type zinc finger protein n=1 Tax=Pseudomonas sp. zfem003 TaxID=3078198 RepID=UPI002929B1CA|nr:TraR/DksA C4-type zinc finger protein [Pseudomonas sp. zfem003]MDU9398060.1 TraR/DksA C4-type zinc finger protein [Pseudomonas sp. zfem003]
MNTDQLLEMELDLQERERQDRISRMQRHGASRTHCAECGEEIPQARQRAIRGVTLCVDCQELSELMGVRHG